MGDILPTVYAHHGEFSTACGGTRQGAQNFKRLLNRPWDGGDKLTVGGTCPFETYPQNEIPREDSVGGDWRIIKNLATPYDRGHHLIIPERCLPDEVLWEMGGQTRFFEALRLAQVYAPISDEEVQVYIHVGFLGAQNARHLHWHLLAPLHRGTSLEDRMAAEAIFRLVQLGNEKWQADGSNLKPDYSLLMRFWPGWRFGMAIYTPILNHLGGSEVMASLFPAHYNYVLPATDAEVAAYLKS